MKGSIVVLVLGLFTALPPSGSAEPIHDAVASRAVADQKVGQLNQALRALMGVHNELRHLLPYTSGAPYSEKYDTTINHLPAWAELTEAWLQKGAAEQHREGPVAEWITRWRAQFAVTQKAAREFVVAVNRGYYALEQLPPPIRAASALIMNIRYDLITEMGCEKPGIFRHDGKVCYPTDMMDKLRCAVSLAEAAVLNEIAVTK